MTPLLIMKTPSSFCLSAVNLRLYRVGEIMKCRYIFSLRAEVKYIMPHRNILSASDGVIFEISNGIYASSRKIRSKITFIEYRHYTYQLCYIIIGNSGAFWSSNESYYAGKYFRVAARGAAGDVSQRCVMTNYICLAIIFSLASHIT